MRSNLELMQQIHERWGPRILKFEPPLQPFLAALVANESEGDSDSTRFEPGVFRHLAAVCPDWTIEKLNANSHSWGLTQIMGYHYHGDPAELCQPELSLSLTVSLLADFQSRFKLAADDWPNLFRCWNTGHPQGKTYDPAYVANGLERMRLWGGVRAASEPKGAGV